MIFAGADFSKPINDLQSFFENIEFMPFLNAVGYFLLGLLITMIAVWFVGKISERNISAHHSMLFKRITFYLGLAFSIVFPLKASGIDVTALLGAAGILTAVVAFAAQTSISNFLSGVFLVAEKPFVIGDEILVHDILGEVLSIDLLSIKLRTKDNTLVRIPNHTLLNAQFRNVSRFPIRRFDMILRVQFDADLEEIKEILMVAAGKNPLCLVSPPPELTFLEFGETGIVLQFSVWGKQSSYSTMQSSIQTDIQQALIKHDIKLPAVLLSKIDLEAALGKTPHAKSTH